MDQISKDSQGEESLVWGPQELLFCFLQTMWSCWLHQTVTNRLHWDNLQLSVKLLGSESVTPSLTLVLCQKTSLLSWRCAAASSEDSLSISFLFMSEKDDWKADQCRVTDKSLNTKREPSQMVQVLGFSCHLWSWALVERMALENQRALF